MKGVTIYVLVVVFYFIYRVLNQQQQLKKLQSELVSINKHLQEKIQKAVDESRQKDTLLIQQSKMASMGEMIGNIAYQWRQPLNALGLTVQKIKMYHEEDMLTTK
jgi:phosphoglycerate-specific signal transduction histidine kinase